MTSALPSEQIEAMDALVQQADAELFNLRSPKAHETMKLCRLAVATLRAQSEGVDEAKELELYRKWLRETHKDLADLWRPQPEEAWLARARLSPKEP